MPRKRKPPRVGNCTYCHATARLTDDHVPPRNLFPAGTTGILKVPACEQCNSGASLDDEYFRLCISVSHDPKAAPPGSDVTLAAINRLKEPTKAGLRKHMLSWIREFELHSPAGLFLGRVSGMEVDRERILRVLRRIVKGLFFHLDGQRLPPKCEVTVVPFADFCRSPGSAATAALLHPLCAASENRVGGHVFAYRSVTAVGEFGYSAWYLRFFSTMEFIALTGLARERGDRGS